jgi:hypothetical protein
MNQKIQDLMYHSGLTAQGCWDEMDDYDKQAIEKFAELIVKECASVADQHVVEGDWDIAKIIKQQFGFEK